MLTYFPQYETGKHRKLLHHGTDQTESYHEETQTLLLLKFIFQMMQTYRYISPESNTVLPHFQQDFIGMETKGQNHEDLLNMFLNN